MGRPPTQRAGEFNGCRVLGDFGSKRQGPRTVRDVPEEVNMVQGLGLKGLRV